MIFPAGRYSIAAILHLLLLSQWWCGLSATHIHICTDLLSRALSIWAHLVLHHEVKHSTCSPALPGVGEDPDHALIMTCQKGMALHAAAFFALLCHLSSYIPGSVEQSQVFLGLFTHQVWYLYLYLHIMLIKNEPASLSMCHIPVT